MLRVVGCEFCFIPILFVYMCVRMPSSPRPIVGVPLGRALPGFFIQLVLHTTCVHSCSNWRASCVAAKHPKNKNCVMNHLSSFELLDGRHQWRLGGASRPPNYCAPSVSVPDVLGG